MRAGGTLVEDGEADGGDHKDDRRPCGEAGEHIGRGAGAEGGLRTLSAEGAGEIGRAALLEQDDPDEENAHQHMRNDDDVEKNLHNRNCFPSLARLTRRRRIFGAEEGT